MWSQSIKPTDCFDKRIFQIIFLYLYPTCTSCWCYSNPLIILCSKPSPHLGSCSLFCVLCFNPSCFFLGLFSSILGCTFPRSLFCLVGMSFSHLPLPSICNLQCMLFHHPPQAQPHIVIIFFTFVEMRIHCNCMQRFCSVTSIMSWAL